MGELVGFPGRTLPVDWLRKWKEYLLRCEAFAALQRETAATSESLRAEGEALLKELGH